MSLEKEMEKLFSEYDELMKMCFSQMDVRTIVSMGAEEFEVFQKLLTILNSTEKCMLLMAEKIDRQSEILEKVNVWVSAQKAVI